MENCKTLIEENKPHTAEELLMKTAVIVMPGKIKISNRTIKPPEEKQIRIKLQGCGICGSNIPVWEGRKWFQYPCEEGSPGHEGWGIIESTGTGVSDFAIGDRVTFLSNHAFSEYENVNEKNVVKLPEIINDQPFPGEPFGCAMNIFSRCEAKAGDVIAIVGIGFIGAILTALAVHSGARVIAISRRKYSLSIAKDMGASDVIVMEGPDTIGDKVKNMTGGKLCDCVVEATGFQYCLDIASKLIRIRGRLVIAGYHQDGLRTVNLQEWNWKGIDVINAHERDESIYVNGIRRAVNAVSKGFLNPSKLCTHNFPIDSIHEAFEMTERRPEGFLKAIVVM